MKTLKEVNIIADNISNKMVELNYKMFTAVQNEEFELAAQIKKALDKFINNSALFLCEETMGNYYEIQSGLIENSKLIFKEIKNTN
jgi:hypothetical protein